MKKKSKPNLSNLPKGQKLPYARLRHLINELLFRYPAQSWSVRQIIKELKIGNNVQDVDRVMNALIKQNLIREPESGKFQTIKSNKQTPKAEETPAKFRGKNVIVLEGKVDLTRSGAGYIIIEGREDDIYVPAKWMGGAHNKDIVLVEPVAGKRGGRTEGRVVKIIRRALTQSMGTIKLFKKFAIVTPDRASLNFDIMIPLEKIHSAVDGDKVVVTINEWNGNVPVGEVNTVIGASGSHELEMQSILIHHGFNPAWPADVITESLKLPDEIPAEEIARRRDFRNVTTFTIDPLTAKDFDDALSIQHLPDGRIEIGVHIADVSHYVKPNTLLDKEAYLRSTSVYLVDRVCPMLPEKLSNELCSLRPHEESLCYSAVFEFDKEFTIVNRWFGRTVIYSDHRFAYEEAQVVMDDKTGPYADELLLLNEIARTYRKKRFKNGAINFETDELQFNVDEAGETLEIFVKERKEAHMLIEEFMLLANREVATFIAKKGKSQEIPLPYRVHDVPDHEKLVEFQRFAKELGFNMQIDTPKQIAKSFNKLAEEAKHNETLHLLEPLAIRTMSKAVYTTKNIGHYGLAFDYYAHFTSPIRRYADVLVHRILDANLDAINRTNKENLEAQCKHISDKERAAMAAERESVKYKQMEFMKNKVGQEFAGVITGVIEHGIFVELNESKAEGLVPFRTMHGGFYQTTMFKAGNRKGDELSIGQQVNVRITKINLESRQMDLELVTDEQPEVKRKVPVKRRKS